MSLFILIPRIKQYIDIPFWKPISNDFLFAKLTGNQSEKTPNLYVYWKNARMQSFTTRYPATLPNVWEIPEYPQQPTSLSWVTFNVSLYRAQKQWQLNTAQA